MVRHFPGGLLIALQIGCLGDALGAADTPPQQRDMRIDETPLFTIGDDPDEALHEVIGAAISDDALILAEASTYSLRFYDRATGRLLHTVGQEGEGPGDYGSLDLLQAVGDRLYTYDGWLLRVTVRDGAGEVERTLPIRPWGDYNAADVKGFFPDGSMLVSAWTHRWEQTPTIRRFNHELARHNPDGTFGSRLGTYSSYEHYAVPGKMSIYPYRREAWVVVLDDRYHVVDNKDPVIPVFDATGGRVRELHPHTPLEPRRLTSAGRDSLPDLEGIDRDDLPRHYPYYGRPRAVGGTLWVPDYSGLVRGGGSTWSVYSGEGGLVGRVTSSELGIAVLAADEDVVAVLVTDELGVQAVQLRRIIERP